MVEPDIAADLTGCAAVTRAFLVTARTVDTGLPRCAACPVALLARVVAAAGIRGDAAAIGTALRRGVRAAATGRGRTDLSGRTTRKPAENVG